MSLAVLAIVSARPAAAEAAILQQAGNPMGMLAGFLPLLLIFGVFYFLLIRPQQVRQKKWAAALETLKSGDRVVTSGGIRGVIIAVKDDCFHLRVPPDNLRLEVAKTAIVSAETQEEKS